MSIKVLYDTLIIGIAQSDAKEKTGIYRVTKNIADGLSRAEEVELSFSNHHPYSKYAHEYLSADPVLRQHPIQYPSASQEKIVRLANRLRSWQTAMQNRTTNQAILSKGMYALGSKSLTPLLMAANKLHHKAQQSALANLQVYHSPFHPIPHFARTTPHLKKFVTFYDLIPHIYPNYFRDSYIGEVIRQAAKSILPNGYGFSISQSTKNDLCNFEPAIDPEHIFVTHLAADINVFYSFPDAETAAQVRSRYGIPDAPYFLSLCTLEPRKNIDHVVRCFVKLVNEQHLNDANLVLVGVKGWKFERIFNEIEDSRHLKNRVIVTGFADDRDLSAIYSGALGFLYMSFYEGFGLPPLEAMQCGVPVVTSDTSSLPEVVGGAGIMLGPTDADGLCQAMLRLYGDSGLRAEMSQKSLARAANFSWEKTVQQTIQVYKKSLND